MTHLSCQINHYRSLIDDTDQPYAILGPAEVEEEAACVMLLHPALADAGKDAFIEYAFEEMARWRRAIEHSHRAVLLVIPRGRGHASWIGPAGDDLFGVLDDVSKHYSIDSDSLYLVGEGPGATGAIQLACWYPDRWGALAVAAPTLDERSSGDVPAPKKWEEGVRSSLRPSTLIANLSGLPIRAEHPWWHDGTGGTAHPDRFREFEALVERHGLAVEFRRSQPISPGNKSWPVDPDECLGWLLQHRKSQVPFRNVLLATSRSCLDSIAVDRFREYGKPARLRVRAEGTSLRLQTSGVSQLSVRPQGIESISIDSKRAFNLSKERNGRMPQWLTWDRVGDHWSRREEDVSGGVPAIKSRGLSGPIMDMRWSGVTFVHGTLGDDFENETMKGIARDIRDAWVTGSDSPAIHPGRSDADIDYGLIADDAVTEEVLQGRHLVVVGTPRTNLLLARWRGLLGCQWTHAIDEEECIEPFRLGARLFEHPRDGLFLLGLHPESSRRYLLVVTGTTIAGLTYAKSHRTAFMPDYVVFNGSEVLQAGYCGADWRP